jgi:SPP1 family holin
MNTKIRPETIARTIVLALALINQCLAIMGKGTIDIAENDVYQTVSLVWTIVSAIVAWWYNNSFTKHARRADELLEALKNGGIE